MSMSSNLGNFAVWVGGQFKAVRVYVDQQVSAVRTDLTAAITQAKTDVATQVKTDILGGAAPAYDTLLELQQAIQADDSAVTGLQTALAKRVRVDATQSFTAGEQLQARANIGAVAVADLGPTDTDYVAIATAALNS